MSAALGFLGALLIVAAYAAVSFLVIGWRTQGGNYIERNDILAGAGWPLLPLVWLGRLIRRLSRAVAARIAKRFKSMPPPQRVDHWLMRIGEEWRCQLDMRRHPEDYDDYVEAIS